VPRTLVIDNVQLLRVQLLRNPNGEAEVYAEYALRAGGQVVQTVHKQLTTVVGPGRKQAVLALLDGLAADAAAHEQV
jgi:hypothetical protein